MTRVVRSNTSEGALLSIAGTVDENFHLAREVAATGPISGTVILNLHDIQKINSPGVRNWMLSMQELVKQASFRYVECSPAIVECLNLVVNFAAGAAIDSILLPYNCSSCRRESLVLCSTQDLIKSRGSAGPVPCPNCKQGTAEFDDFPEAYFEFLKLG